MTTVYFIRHAESDTSVKDGLIRPLTEKGMRDRALVTSYLADKEISAVLSSPYKRAVDTIADFAAKRGLTIETVANFRERKSDSDMPRSDAGFVRFLKHQWEDFSYTHSDGECLRDVQVRNIAALNEALIRYRGQNIAIGTHGTALSTIINYYDCSYGFDDFMNMLEIMPWIVKMQFDGCIFRSIDKIDIITL